MTTIQTTDASDHDEFEPAPPDKLYAHYCRQLSAMMDGELSPDEAKFMLRRLEHDTALAGCWERWQICGDVLRGRRHALLPADFAQRVALAIAEDGSASVAVTAGMKSRPRLARWGSGAALAASVAVVAFLVARQLPDEAGSAPQTSSTIVAQTPATPPAPAPTPVETPRTMTETPPASGTGAAVTATALAAAEVPRRASERRARARGQRAADRVRAQGSNVLARDVAASPPMVAAAGLPELAEVPTTETAAVATPPDLFAAPDIAPTRPWPRAILRAYPADSAFSAGYGDPAASGFAPFEPTSLVPRLDAGRAAIAIPQQPVPDGTDSNSTDSSDTDPAAEARDANTPH